MLIKFTKKLKGVVGKMKLVIPLRIQLAGISYKIVANDWLLDKMDHKAFFSSKDQKIYLHTGLSPEATFDCLIHEICHIASYTSGHELEEKANVGISSLLGQAFLSMGIEPDFSIIPEEDEPGRGKRRKRVSILARR